MQAQAHRAGQARLAGPSTGTLCTPNINASLLQKTGLQPLAWQVRCQNARRLQAGACCQQLARHAVKCPTLAAVNGASSQHHDACGWQKRMDRALRAQLSLLCLRLQRQEGCWCQTASIQVHLCHAAGVNFQLRPPWVPFSREAVVSLLPGSHGFEPGNLRFSELRRQNGTWCVAWASTHCHTLGKGTAAW